MGGRSDRWEEFILSREEEESGEAETGRVKGHVRPSPASTAHTLSHSHCQVGLQRLHLLCVCARERETEQPNATLTIAVFHCSFSQYEI